MLHLLCSDVALRDKSVLHPNKAVQAVNLAILTAVPTSYIFVACVNLLLLLIASGCNRSTVLVAFCTRASRGTTDHPVVVAYRVMSTPTLPSSKRCPMLAVSMMH